ncbi:hypothetical protein TURU_008789 [Turdus rufiventris]|nr:hypothetical protein TURU_008789 [Turdus rufiventris]
MDDILAAAPTQEGLLRIEPQLLTDLRCYGLQVAPDKVQRKTPWRYLGIKILDQMIQHQEVQFADSIKTLNDPQKLLGIIGWLHPCLELTKEQLSPLFDILKGDTRLDSPQTLTLEARRALQLVQRALSTHQVYRVDPSVDITVFIINPDLYPTGVIAQWNDTWSDPLHILEWVFLPNQLEKTATTVFDLLALMILKCHQRCVQLMAADPARIILPIEWEFFGGAFINSVPLQSALQEFTGQIVYHLPRHKLLHMAKTVKLSLRPKNSRVPVRGPTIFTDRSGKIGKAIVTWKDESGC